MKSAALDTGFRPVTLRLWHGAYLSTEDVGEVFSFLGSELSWTGATAGSFVRLVVREFLKIPFTFYHQENAIRLTFYI